MRTIAVVTADPVVLMPLSAVAERLGAQVAAFRGVSEIAEAIGSEAPLAIVANLELAEAVMAAADWRARWPDTFLAAFISRPDRALWDAALASGFDLVATRGAIPRQLEQRLAAWPGRAAGRRIRLFAVDDVAGRLGVVHRLEDEQAGPIAVYHIGGVLYAAGDVCPHAGARLSQGTLDRSTITCPLHGSQFDVRTGERLRGPADDPIPVCTVEVTDGTAYLVLGAG